MIADRALVARMDASLMDYWGTYGLAEGGRLEKLRDALFMQTTIPHSLFNSVILSGHDPDATETALGLGAECARNAGVPVLWRVGPAADTAGLRARLEDAGLKPGEPHPAMLADLDDLDDMPTEPVIDGLVIKTAKGPEERRTWGRLTIASFEMEESLGEAMGACEATIPPDMFGDQPRYTAYLDGEPVAVSSLVMTDGIAGIYAVATLPRARARGIGTAMTLHAMAEGRRRGARMATLQATSMGRPVYEKIGFRTIFDYQTYLQA
ncbi:GNAT family N-acetyltransferase [Ovoidimarina sediminis]|uniref:GNAT family N-acetyltransferase n=1 Tax=Ovoidimarina sediminis TaxID=3079856 RepID=UPI002912D8AA|nr:GNAT family N-acetyltransferase [Rhodophyticola sp. MJ-SS7]MDU8946345.1 GNAT family N-acetyltransferase [Rhodophyticola sp. MJ-SS7]